MSLVFVEKGIDREGKIWYTNKAVASGGPSAGARRTLKTIQRRERAQQRGREIRRYLGARKLSERKEVRIQRESCESAKRKSLARRKGGKRSSGRIEHKSLILAQDERWRRA